MLGLKEQHMYDIYMPLVENADIGVSYEEAYDIVVEGLAPLGKIIRRCCAARKTSAG